MRWWAHLRAWWGHYFWTACPICGFMFGGHEWKDRDGHRSAIPMIGSQMMGTAICPRCTRHGIGDALMAIRNDIVIQLWRDYREGRQS